MLKSITKANVSADNRAKIYFCAHPKDVDEYLSIIADEIFAKNPGVAIWYYDPNSSIPAIEERDFELSQMQAFVVPITSNFLNDTNIGLEDFQYAVSHKIPILPLLQEPELGTRFNEVCGNIQFLDKNSNDATSIAYEIKLDRFIKMHIVDENLLSQLRSAFCTFVFMSYRKTDRKSAQEIMRRIHCTDILCDIGIWYDEFLSAGEPFDEVIKKAIDESEIVTFAVTPNFLEDGNYIQKSPDGEYLYAQGKGKTLLPVEIIKTDQNQLREKYPGIPDCVGCTVDEIKEAIENQLKRLAIVHKPQDALHTYLLGIAYLNGIYVEMDKGRGIRYIESAYNLSERIADTLPEVGKTIAELYYWGNGVAVDYVKAANYQLEYCRYLMSKEKAIANDEEIIRELFWLADICMQPRDSSSFGSTRVVSRKLAVDAYREVCRLCEKTLCVNEKVAEFLGIYAAVSIVLGNILYYSANETDDWEYKSALFEEAVSMYEKHINILNEHPSVTNQFIRDYYIEKSTAYATYASHLVGMAINHKDAKKKMHTAIELYELAVNSELNQRNCQSTVRLTGYYEEIGRLYYCLKEYNQAISYFQKVLDIYNGLRCEHHSYTLIKNRMIYSLGKIAEMLIKTGRKEEAIPYYKELSKHRILVNWSDMD